MTKASKAESKKRISGVRTQVGSVSPNGHYFKFYLTQMSSNPSQCKAEKDDSVWPNQDDVKPVLAELIPVTDGSCPLCGGHMTTVLRDRDHHVGMKVAPGNPVDIPQSISQPLYSCSACGYTSGLMLTGNSEPYDFPSEG